MLAPSPQLLASSNAFTQELISSSLTPFHTHTHTHTPTHTHTHTHTHDTHHPPPTPPPTPPHTHTPTHTVHIFYEIFMITKSAFSFQQTLIKASPTRGSSNNHGKGRG